MTILAAPGDKIQRFAHHTNLALTTSGTWWDSSDWGGENEKVKDSATLSNLRVILQSGR